MMQDQMLDFSRSDELAGFRLQRLEVFNWGTFDRRVWSLELDGHNGLLTGDIGSGKSTLVDAMTTLLVPANRVAYNKAAGADNKERSLRSYVLGYYKSERSETGQQARPVALRDHRSYSVILAVFANEGFGQQVSLAQVFWHKDTQGQPARFYVVAREALSIQSDFAGFGEDLRALRKRLRGRSQLELFDSFPPYEAAFRRQFGIDNEQALSLFHQTVSMKSVGNLTDFVREHMLESFAVEPRIDALIHHFDDLNRAHEAVLKARAQVEALTPLVADCDRHHRISQARDRWQACREALSAWFSHQLVSLLDKRLENLTVEQQRQQHRRDQQHSQLGEQRGERDRLRQAIADNGGDRLQQLQTRIESLATLRDKRQANAQRYGELAEALDLPPKPDLEQFSQTLSLLGRRREALEQEQAEWQNQATEAAVELRELKTRHHTLSEEIESLRQRKSNIDSRQIGIRQLLCQTLGLDEQALPFAGELLRVREDEQAWEGAAERVLHNFALSLLVPDEHYPAVAEWVNQTRLGGRLVYYRVRQSRLDAMPSLHPDSLVHKLEVRPDSAFYAWLERELARRFDYACCDDLTQFRRERMALTPAGQIKANQQRHEKDDRHRLDDRSRYVLGWTNRAKIEALQRQCATLERSMQALAERLAQSEQRQRELIERREAIVRLADIEDFNDIDWQQPATEISALQAEREQLQAASDRLRLLTEQLQALEAAILDSESALSEHERALARLEEKQAVASEARQQAEQRLAEQAQAEAWFETLDELRPQALGEQQITIESAQNREQQMREWLQAKLDAEAKRLRSLEERIHRAMVEYCHAYPLETQEVDATLAAADDYRGMLKALQADDLPRFEQRFKALLNENTIREVAGFQSQLNRERQLIRERIERINQSLADIEYNPGRYIVLEAQNNQDAEIRDFQQQLRACTEDSLTGAEDDQYAESKFLQVRAIIERFRGREGLSELDKRWTRKVTDVRYWFAFAASERWREDDTEYEHYTDSGGKSGGQKEKLAYTVLAASLAYQFGLEWGEVRSRSFRFVMIDEAFGRGSDESARFGLELFKRLNLQLLIVTPLQKIHIIEPYVAHVGFVHNPEGRQSLLRNLTIEQYRAERQARTG